MLRKVVWLVVVLLVALFVTGIVVNVLQKREQAKVAKAVQDIAALENSFQMYSIDVGDYPSTEDGIQSLWRAPQPISENWRGPYVQKPNFTDPWGSEYVYVYPGNHEGFDYDLESLGEDGQKGTDDDITNWVFGQKNLDGTSTAGILVEGKPKSVSFTTKIGVFIGSFIGIIIFLLILRFLAFMLRKKCPECGSRKIEKKSTSVISQGYKNVTKSGQPDKRFKDNPMLETMEDVWECRNEKKGCSHSWKEHWIRRA